jgi:hypothetical protein
VAMKPTVNLAPGSRSSPLAPLQFQRRWLGAKYHQKIKDAQEAWEVQAEELQAGTRKHLFDELQDRGLIKDVVG